MIALERRENFQEVTGGHTIKRGNVFKKVCTDRKKSMPCSLAKSSQCFAKIVNVQNVYKSRNKKNV